MHKLLEENAQSDDRTMPLPSVRLGTLAWHHAAMVLPGKSWQEVIQRLALPLQSFGFGRLNYISTT